MCDKYNAEAYELGQRYRIDFDKENRDDWPSSLYVKTIQEIAPIMRLVYPNEKNWRAVRLKTDGSETSTLATRAMAALEHYKEHHSHWTYANQVYHAGWENDEWTCPLCETMFGKNLNGDKPFLLSREHSEKCCETSNDN